MQEGSGISIPGSFRGHGGCRMSESFEYLLSRGSEPRELVKGKCLPLVSGQFDSNIFIDP